jgi:hypothetical protein
MAKKKSRQIVIDLDEIATQLKVIGSGFAYLAKDSFDTIVIDLEKEKNISAEGRKAADETKRRFKRIINGFRSEPAAKTSK